MTKSPRVIASVMIARPPTRIITTLMRPMITEENDVTAETPVTDLATLRRSRCAPLAKIRSSFRSEVYALTMRTPARLSPSRPVTSALIRPRSRNNGLRRLKAMAMAPPKTSRIDMVNRVSTQLTYSRIAKQVADITRPPVSCTSPVPTRFLIPSASVMIREMRTPDFVESK